MVAARKAEAILKAGGRLIVVAEHIDEALRNMCQKTTAGLIEGRYSKDYLARASIVIAATDNVELNRQVYSDCEEFKILCNVVDSPELCDFFVPAVVKRGDLQIAIGTEGNCPAYAGHLRKKLEGIFTEEHGRFLAELEAVRKLAIEEIEDEDGRKALLGRLVNDESFEYFTEHGAEAWRKRAQNSIKESKSAQE